MTTLQYFRIIAPAFSASTDETVTVWIGIAETMADVDCLGDEDKAAQALAAYTAHLMQVTQDAGQNTGSVTSEREGDLSRSYGAMAGSDTWLGSTTYGAMYKQMTIACGGIGIITRFGVDGGY